MPASPPRTALRATFRTWASETTGFDKDVIETCLAHAQGELDSAYHRGSAISTSDAA